MFKYFCLAFDFKKNAFQSYFFFFFLLPFLKLNSLENQGSESFFLKLASSSYVEAEGGEILFITALASNSLDICLSLPEGWISVATSEESQECSPEEVTVQIFGVKVPSDARSGQYLLELRVEGEPSGQTIMVNVHPRIAFTAHVANVCSQYPLNAPLDLDITCCNEGNIPLHIYLEAEGDPHCLLEYDRTLIEVPPYAERKTEVHVEPFLGKDDPYQFLLLKFVNAETGEVLHRLSSRLKMSQTSSCMNDLFIRVPSHVSIIGMGVHNCYSAAVEIAGGGIVDENRKRFMEYCIRLPTNEHCNRFGIDQRLFFGLREPEWEIFFGDTVYELTPLTQRYRYGRGCEIDIYQDKWAAGAHCTQGFSRSWNPKEAAAFIALHPRSNLTVSGNYLHKAMRHEPVAQIGTLEAEIEFPEKIYTELEFGKNFGQHSPKRDPYAFHIETQGNYREGIWFTFEKMYAGPGFHGYYNYVDLSSAVVDFPVGRWVRGSIAATRLKQNFSSRSVNDSCAVAPRQRQYSANFSYQLRPEVALSFNGFLLRARDAGKKEQYNFYQTWGGPTVSFFHKGYSGSLMASYGNQKNYKKNKEKSFLQRYNCFVGKQLTHRLYGALVYEAGNMNYYDVKPWRALYGGSVAYRYEPRSLIELLVQRVKNSPKESTFTQATLRFNHLFRNHHELQSISQYYHHPTCGSQFQFFIAYTMPFGLAIGKNQARGGVEGTVYDTWRKCPVPDALISLNENTLFTDDQGRFSFSGLRPGEAVLRAEILPDRLATEGSASQLVQIYGGGIQKVMIHALPVAALTGELVLYAFEEVPEQLLQLDKDPHMIKKEGIADMRIFLEKEGGEIYSTLTDASGRFTFPCLAPGKWCVTVSADYLPQWHHLNVNRTFVVLEPEEEKHIVFKVFPDMPNIHPLEE